VSLAWDFMAWAKPDYSRGKVDDAGEALSRDPGEPALSLFEYAEALTVLNNWRSAHSYPLQVLKMTLLTRARKISPRALVAQRLKRLSSIKVKLSAERNRHMKLSQMQDIGGCRAVMPTVRAVRSLERRIEKSVAKNPSRRPEGIKKYDYIAHPKEDGYRSIHFVFKYRTTSKHREVFNGLRIEIQLRSRLQHAWATAVETVSTFTGQALKSNIGTDEWKRFFAVMGSVIALRERQPLVPNTPLDKAELISELKTLVARLQVEEVLAGYGYAVKRITDNVQNASAYLLVLDTNAKTIRITGFKKTELSKASDEYLRIEKTSADNPHIQAVLVSVESVAALPSAYPNYYLDTAEFIKELRRALSLFTL
jgi:ppGpp synthetase/RelA/SpoT-type nucleotidyltranferase